jgi:hypothetical protein
LHWWHVRWSSSRQQLRLQQGLIITAQDDTPARLPITTDTTGIVIVAAILRGPPA